MKMCKSDVLLGYFGSLSVEKANRCDTKGRCLLHLAVASGNEELVKNFLAAGAKVFDTNQAEILDTAGIFSSESLIRILLEADADPLASSDDATGYEILAAGGEHWTASFLKFMVGVVQDAGGQLDIKGKHGFLLLCLAAVDWRCRSLKALLDLGATPVGNWCPNPCPLAVAAQNRRKTCSKALMNAVKRTGDDDAILLHGIRGMRASLNYSGNYKLFLHFLEAGVDFVSPSEDQPSVFVTAILLQRTRALRAMLDVRPEILNSENLQTALFWILDCSRYYPDGLESLLTLYNTRKTGTVDFSFQHERDNTTILHYLLMEETPVNNQLVLLVQRVLDTGMDLTKQMNTGETCLHTALKYHAVTSNIVLPIWRAAMFRCP